MHDDECTLVDGSRIDDAEWHQEFYISMMYKQWQAGGYDALNGPAWAAKALNYYAFVAGELQNDLMERARV